MARIITKELAIKIAKKLGAQKVVKKNRPHDNYLVFQDGLLVARFSIRRGSEKDKGHDHIPAEIHLSAHDAKLFAQCAHAYDYWVEEMRIKGIIPREQTRNG